MFLISIARLVVVGMLLIYKTCDPNAELRMHVREPVELLQTGLVAKRLLNVV